jgi:transcriptional antiterminator RfaH
MVKLQAFETVDAEHPDTPDPDDPARESSFKSQPRWYLVHCKARQEQRALEHLQRQGFECYFPLYEKERLRRDRRERVWEGLFPGYVFIQLDSIHDNWLPIRSTRGVIQIVRFNNYPLPVADALIEQLQRSIERRPLREPYLKSGERVVISVGCFSGVEAIFVASDGDERVMLLLSILQSDQTLSFPVGGVRKLNGKAYPV